MTNQDAHEIAKNVAFFEFPLFYDLATRLALFEVSMSSEDTSSTRLTRTRHMRLRTLQSSSSLLVISTSGIPYLSGMSFRAVNGVSGLHGGRYEDTEVIFAWYAHRP